MQLKTNKYLQIDELKTEKGVHLMMGTKSIKLCSNLLPLIFETYSDPVREVWWALYHYTVQPSLCAHLRSPLIIASGFSKDLYMYVKNGFLTMQLNAQTSTKLLYCTYILAEAMSS